MADMAASVLARLKNKAEETGRSNQLCLQLFCQEEFLRRLQRSKYAENLILKGGLFVYALTHFDSRVTVDVDFLLKNIPNTPQKLRLVLEDIIAAETGNNFVNFEIIKIGPIAVVKKYTGIGATVIARIKNTRTTFGVDFGVGDVIVPGHEKRQIPTQLDDFEAPLVNTYSVETTIAEKLDAILFLMEFSSRMKDYYDVFYLSQKFNFDGEILRTAIEQTFKNRDRRFTPEQFEQLLALGDDSAMKKKWIAFIKKVKGADDNFTDMLGAIGVFLREIVSAVFENRLFTKAWSATDNKWR
jgi:predicted nucleotidyltransferase component of viral defense system